MRTMQQDAKNKVDQTNNTQLTNQPTKQNDRKKEGSWKNSRIVDNALRMLKKEGKKMNEKSLTEQIAKK